MLQVLTKFDWCRI